MSEHGDITCFFAMPPGKPYLVLFSHSNVEFVFTIRFYGCIVSAESKGYCPCLGTYTFNGKVVGWGLGTPNAGNCASCMRIGYCDVHSSCVGCMKHVLVCSRASLYRAQDAYPVLAGRLNAEDVDRYRSSIPTVDPGAPPAPCK